MNNETCKHKKYKEKIGNEKPMKRNNLLGKKIYEKLPKINLLEDSKTVLPLAKVNVIMLATATVITYLPWPPWVM